uniref:Uncharacterized protein n=1 Tax=Aegilops tauschii subsp. strangulata TaxID=200361 RepID=A0A453K6S8_AEGTS
MAQPSKEPCKKEACDIQACLSKNLFDSKKYGPVLSPSLGSCAC